MQHTKNSLFVMNTELANKHRGERNLKKEITVHKKPYCLSPNILKRWYFQKNGIGIWNFLYYQEIWYFFYPKIWSYSLDGKWKMIFLKKRHGNMMLSGNAPKKLSFQKNRTETLSYLLSGKMRAFFSKIW